MNRPGAEMAVEIPDDVPDNAFMNQHEFLHARVKAGLGQFSGTVSSDKVLSLLKEGTDAPKVDHVAVP